MNDWNERAVEAADAIRRLNRVAPRVGIILGSGLGPAASSVAAATRISTAAIPHFPRSTVVGHAGELIVGTLGGKSVAVLSGRVHGYEGYLPAEVGFPTRFLHALGCQDLIVTNAAGALNPDFRPGDLMIIEDHISFPSLAGLGPLVGSASAGLPRFVDMSNAYAPELRALAEDAGAAVRTGLRRGVYIMVAGPNFETPAEVRFLRLAGGDAVGMSTVPEVIVARQLGMRVLGLSVISNLAAGIHGALLGHEDILTVVAGAVPGVVRIVEGVLSRLPE